MAKKQHSTRSRTKLTIHPNATALTIAGSDPSGGAGLQADLKTFQQFGVYGMSVVTLLTVQNTQSVSQVEVLSPEFVLAQLDAVLSDIPPRAIKTGALGRSQIVEAIAPRLRDLDCPIVVDPVLVSKHGQLLVTDDVVQAYKQHLLPHVFLITPNRFEAERLTGVKLDSIDAASEAIQVLEQLGVKHVLIKLGEIEGRSHHLLSTVDSDVELVCARLPNKNTHGTGCILSAAITAYFALQEVDLRKAVLFGIEQTFQAIHLNTHLGKGIHPAETRAMIFTAPH